MLIVLSVLAAAILGPFIFYLVITILELAWEFWEDIWARLKDFFNA